VGGKTPRGLFQDLHKKKPVLGRGQKKENQIVKKEEQGKTEPRAGAGRWTGSTKRKVHTNNKERVAKKIKSGGTGKPSPLTGGVEEKGPGVK